MTVLRTIDDLFKLVNDLNDRLSTIETNYQFDIVQPGTVVDLASSTIPLGYVNCDGAAISRVLYPVLFNVIGTFWGVGDGSTTFNVPDLRGQVTIGRGLAKSGTTYNLGDSGGSESVQLTGAQSGVAAHSHTITDPGHKHTSGGGLTQYVIDSGANTVGGAATTPFNQFGMDNATTGISINNASAASASSSHENRQPYVTLTKMIKT